MSMDKPWSQSDKVREVSSWRHRDYIRLPDSRGEAHVWLGNDAVRDAVGVERRKHLDDEEYQTFREWGTRIGDGRNETHQGSLTE